MFFYVNDDPISFESVSSGLKIPDCTSEIHKIINAVDDLFLLDIKGSTNTDKPIKVLPNLTLAENFYALRKQAEAYFDHLESKLNATVSVSSRLS
ncbi:hypothetical protein AGMMS49975_23540 [Clostridia bacterium]|nr:hypothetical protein AGMMS49975_23540 [Clostridia bacterium]